MNSEPYTLDIADAAIAKGMLARGDRQSDIAAWFGVNGGRIAEINTGQKWHGVIATPLDQLPPPGPYMAHRSAYEMRDTLITLHAVINRTLRYLDEWEGKR